MDKSKFDAAPKYQNIFSPRVSNADRSLSKMFTIFKFSSAESKISFVSAILCIADSLKSSLFFNEESILIRNQQEIPLQTSEIEWSSRMSASRSNGDSKLRLNNVSFLIICRRQDNSVFSES
jgi:hypothetical protein